MVSAQKPVAKLIIRDIMKTKSSKEGFEEQYCVSFVGISVELPPRVRDSMGKSTKGLVLKFNSWEMEAGILG